MKKGYGDLLKKARESKNLKFPEILKELKVDPSYLKALEEENGAIFDKPVYMRLFLRTYAKYLKIEESEIITLFDQTPEGQITEKEINKIKEDIRKDEFTKALVKEDLPPDVKIEGVSNKKQSLIELTMSSKRNLAIVSGSVVILILVIVLAVVVAGKKNGADGKQVYAVAAQNESLTVSVRAKSDTYMKAKSEGGEEDFTLKRGEEKKWKDIQKIVFLVGNAAGVEFVSNGEKIGAIGEEGEVINGLVFQAGKNWYIDKGQGFTQGRKTAAEDDRSKTSETAAQKSTATAQ